MFSKQIDDRQLRVEFVAFLPDLKRVLRAKFRRLDPEARRECVTQRMCRAHAEWERFQDEPAYRGRHRSAA